MRRNFYRQSQSRVSISKMLWPLIITKTKTPGKWPSCAHSLTRPCTSSTKQSVSRLSRRPSEDFFLAKTKNVRGASAVMSGQSQPGGPGQPERRFFVKKHLASMAAAISEGGHGCEGRRWMRGGLRCFDVGAVTPSGAVGDRRPAEDVLCTAPNAAPTRGRRHHSSLQIRRTYWLSQHISYYNIP